MIEDSRNSVNMSKFSETPSKPVPLKPNNYNFSQSYPPLFAYVAPWEAQLVALRAITLNIKMDCGVMRIY